MIQMTSRGKRQMVNSKEILVKRIINSLKFNNKYLKSSLLIRFLICNKNNSGFHSVLNCRRAQHVRDSIRGNGMK